MSPDDKQWIEAAYVQFEAFVAADVVIRRAVEAGAERIYLERTLEDGSVRYVRVCWVGDPEHGGPPETYSLLGGVYRTPQPVRDFDGGTYGTLAGIVEFTRRWIVELVPDSEWSALALAVPASVGVTAG